MAEMMHCLVNYFGFGMDGHGRPLRYYSYHVVGGPGPVDGSGAASITLLAAGDPHELYQIYQNFHVVAEGGSAAAIEKAVRYLDSFHAEDRFRKVRTEIVCSPCSVFPAAERDGYASSKPCSVPALTNGIVQSRERH